jgi:hypothetical protein
VDRKKKETWPLSTSDDNRRLTVGIAGCARPGPQVPDAMPTSIARQVNEWQVRESEVRECVLVRSKGKQRVGAVFCEVWSIETQTAVSGAGWFADAPASNFSRRGISYVTVVPAVNQV